MGHRRRAAGATAAAAAVKGGVTFVRRRDTVLGRAVVPGDLRTRVFRSQNCWRKELAVAATGVRTPRTYVEAGGSRGGSAAAVAPLWAAVDAHDHFWGLWNRRSDDAP